MDKYVVRVPPNSAPEVPNPNAGRPRRREWERNLTELSGRLGPKYKHQLSSLFVQSFSQVGAIPHKFGQQGRDLCMTSLSSSYALPISNPSIWKGISSLEFDNKGVYLASVTKSGCLTVHDYEALYAHAAEKSPSTGQKEPVLHLSLEKQLDGVRWNPLNQDEVACVSAKSNNVLVFDISYVSSDPVEILKSRRDVGVNGSEIHKGFTDISFFVADKSRLIASDTSGEVTVWDRRRGTHPCLQLTSNSRSTLNSIQLIAEDQMVFGAGRNGMVHAWDLRGGRTSCSVQHHKEACHPPLTSYKLASMLERIGSLKAQAAISSTEVHSINVNPSCARQLAFHLNNGWSGVLDIYNSEITHVHCPPPPWLDGTETYLDYLCLRKPSWMRSLSYYVVGSASDDGIHLLDFHPDTTSPCHVDYSEEAEKHAGKPDKAKRNRFIPLSQGATSCATHPITDTIVVGSKKYSLLVVSQPKQRDPDLSPKQ